MSDENLRNAFERFISSFNTNKHDRVFSYLQTAIREYYQKDNNSKRKHFNLLDSYNFSKF